MKRWLWLLFWGMALCTYSLYGQESEERLSLDEEQWKKAVAKERYEPLQASEAESDDSSTRFTQTEDPEVDWESVRVWAIAISLILLAVLLYFLTRFFAKRERQLGNVSRKVEAKTLEEAEENLPAMELNRLLEEHLDLGDYRTAIRLRFLMLLQALIEGGRVNWTRFKTNRSYARELHGSELAASFAQIVEVFDPIWYGHIEPDQARYQDMNGLIDGLMQLIQQPTDGQQQA